MTIQYYCRVNFLLYNDITSLPIVIPQSQTTIPLSHFATISNYAAEKDSIARHNGSEHISLYVYKSSIANPLTVSHNVESSIHSMHLPDIECIIIYNEANEIKKILHNLYVSCILGIILSISILSAFLKNIRLSSPAIIAIPFSLLVIGIYLYAKNSSLNIITLSGIAIAIGMVVDNSIIVIEYITQKTKIINTLSIAQFTAEISKALLASSLTTIVIFVPFILLKQKSTATYTELAGVVITGIIASYIVAVLFVPWLLVHGNTITTPTNFLHASFETLTKRIQINSFFKKCIAYYYNKIQKKFNYLTMLKYAFTHKKTLLLICICLALSTIIPIKHLHFEQFSFTPQNKIFARLELPSGSSLAITAANASIIEEQCKALPYIYDISTRIETSHADFIFTLKDIAYTTTLQSSVQAPHNTSLIFTQNTGEVKNQIDMVIKGNDVGVIRSIAKTFAEKILSTTHVKDIIYHFKEEQPQIAVEFDRIKCAEQSIPIAHAVNYIRSILYGPVISKYITNVEIDIRCRSKQPIDIENDIASIRLPYQNKIIALKEIASIKPSTTITTLWRYDKMRAETISIVPHDNSQQKLEHKLHGIIKNMNIPDGYYIEFGKSYTEQKKTKYHIIVYIIIAVISTYLVLGAIFESFIHPIIVMVSIPFSWICALWAVFVYGTSFNIATALGCIMLTGTVVNNSILLIDSYISVLKKKKTILSLYDYVNLSLHRFRPMLITTLTTVAGLFPLLFAGDEHSLWQGFAITIIIGLCSTLAIIMIITPVIFNFTLAKLHRDP